MMMMRLEAGEQNEYTEEFNAFYGFEEFDEEAYSTYNEFLWEHEGWKTAKTCMPSSWYLLPGRVTCNLNEVEL